MSGRFKKKVGTGKAALLVVLALATVQYIWWRGLVYRPPQTGGGIPPPQIPLPPVLIINGLESVFVDTYIGDTAPGNADGPGYAARLDRPTGLALDGQGNLYVADTGNHRIRKVSPEGIVSTFAGSEAGNTDGPALQAQFNAPCGVSVAPDGTVYVADTGNHCIRCIRNGQVSTVNGKSNGGQQTLPIQEGHARGMSAWGQPKLLPTGIAYVAAATPYLLVADTGGNQLLHCALNGDIVSVQSLPGPPTAVVGSPQLAVAMPSTGTLLLNTKALNTIPIVGTEGTTGIKNLPALRHPTAICPVTGGWLVIDAEWGAVFLLRKERAEVLAGSVSSVASVFGYRDGDGAHAAFNNLCGIVTDGKRYVYVSDTTNNTIRRLTLPDLSQL